MTSPRRTLFIRDPRPATADTPSFYYTRNEFSGVAGRDWTQPAGRFQPRAAWAPTPSSPLMGPIRTSPSPIVLSPFGSPLSPSKATSGFAQARLKELLLEATAIAGREECPPETLQLLSHLNAAVTAHSKGETAENLSGSGSFTRPSPRVTIPEIKRLGASPFLFRKLCRAQAHTELLLGVAFDFAGVQSVAQLQTRVAALCPLLARADSCSLFLSGDQTLHNVATGDTTPLVGLLGDAVLRWEPVHVLYPRHDPRHDPRVDHPSAQAYLCHPLESQGRLLGVLSVVRSTAEATLFGPEELHVVEALADIIGYNLFHLLRPGPDGGPAASAPMDLPEPTSPLTAPTTPMSQCQSHLSPEAELQTNKADSLMALAKHLANAALDEDKLVAAVMQEAKAMTNSDRCSLFVVKDHYLEAHFAEGDVIRMPLDVGIAGYVATTGEKVQIEDAYNDERFNRNVDLQTGYRTKSMLCLPVKYENSVVAVAQLVNKLDDTRQYVPFTRLDEELFEPFAEFAGICLRNCRLHTKLVGQERRGALYRQILERVSGQSLEEEADSVSNIITSGIQELLNCHACALYAVDPETEQLELESITTRTDKEVVTYKAAPSEMYFGIAHDVRRTKRESTIIEEATKDGLKDSTDSGRMVLTLPIVVKGKAIGVVQVFKAPGEEALTRPDMEAIQSLSMFAGIALSNRHLLHFVIVANKQARELIQSQSGSAMSPRRSPAAGGLNHSKLTAPLAEGLVAESMSIQLPDSLKALARTLDFDIFECTTGAPMRHESLEPVILLVFFFEDLGLLDTLSINRMTLFRFIMRARSLYRNIPYHNFFHAFDVTHMMFYLITCLDPEVHFTSVEKLVLMVAGIVHDIDHMGLNNSYHLKCDTPMGILYSSVGIDSVLEIHHCNLAFDILNLPEHNVFGTLTAEDSKNAYRWLVEIILATDMAHHNDLLQQFVQATEKADMPRMLLFKMLIKSADLSNVVRPFFLSKRWAKCVVEEFYAQGDQERKHGRQVTEMFDRTKNVNLADTQIGFINFVAKKHFTAMVNFSTQRLAWMLDNLQTNVKEWEEYKASQADD